MMCEAPGAQGFITKEISELQEARAMHGEGRPARPTSSAAAPDAGDELRVCVNISGLNRAASQDLFWPSRVGRSGGFPCNYVCMPFGLLNMGATYQQFTQLALASFGSCIGSKYAFIRCYDH